MLFRSGPNKTTGYPLVTFYLTGREIKNCLETQSTVAPLKDNYNLQVSGITFLYNPNRVPFDRVYNVKISTPGGGYEPMLPDKLYRVCASYYTSMMLSKMGSLSYGIISVTPKDKSGRPLSDLRQALVDADPKTPGVQELKEWKALADYVSGQPDLNGNNIPDLPRQYSQPAGRYQAVASWNPVDLFRETTRITWGLLLGFISLAGIMILAVRGVSRLIRRDRTTGM